MVWFAVETAVQHGLVEHGDIVLVLAGAPDRHSARGDRRAAHRAGRMTGPIWSEEAGPDDAPLVVLIHGSMDRSAGLLKLSRRLDGDAPRAALRPARLRPLGPAPRAVRDRRAGRRPRRPARRSAGGAVRAQLRRQRRPRPGRPGGPTWCGPSACTSRRCRGSTGGRRTTAGGDALAARRRPGRRRRAVHAPADRRRAVASACRRAPGGPGGPRARRWSASWATCESHAPWEPDAVTVPVVAIHGTRGAAHHGASTAPPRRRCWPTAGSSRSRAPGTSGRTPTPTPSPPCSSSWSAERRRHRDLATEERARRVVDGAGGERRPDPVGAVLDRRRAATTRRRRRAASTRQGEELGRRSSGRPTRARRRRRPPRRGWPARRCAPPRTSTRPRGRLRVRRTWSSARTFAPDRRGRLARAGRVPSLVHDRRASDRDVPRAAVDRAPGARSGGARRSSTGRWPLDDVDRPAGGDRRGRRPPPALPRRLGRARRRRPRRHRALRLLPRRLPPRPRRPAGQRLARLGLRPLVGADQPRLPPLPRRARGDGRADRRARRGRAHRHVPRSSSTPTGRPPAS